MRKVLFLDIDGVLNTLGYESEGPSQRWKIGSWRWHAEMLMPDRVVKLLEVVRQTGCELVISSAWRYDNEPRAITEYLNWNLERALAPSPTFPDLYFDIQHKTPIVGSRGDEIAIWLGLNTVDRYAIVDDWDDFREDQKPFFVQTDPKVGLTDEDAHALIEILNQEP